MSLKHTSCSHLSGFPLSFSLFLNLWFRYQCVSCLHGLSTEYELREREGCDRAIITTGPPSPGLSDSCHHILTCSSQAERRSLAPLLYNKEDNSLQDSSGTDFHSQLHQKQCSERPLLYRPGDLECKEFNSWLWTGKQDECNVQQPHAQGRDILSPEAAIYSHVRQVKMIENVFYQNQYPDHFF